MNAQADFGANLELRQPHEHIQRVGHSAVGGIFQGHDPEIGVTAIHFLEHRRDTADADEFDRLAEALDGGQVGEAVLRAEVGDLDNLLQSPRAAHDLAKNRPHRIGIQRAFAGIQDVLENFFFACRGKNLGTLIVFDTANFGRQRGPFIDQFEDLQVQSVNLRAEMANRSGGPAGSRIPAGFQFGRHWSSRPQVLFCAGNS